MRRLLIFGFVSLGFWASPGVAAETRESLVAAVNAAPDKGSLTVVLAQVHSARIPAFFRIGRDGNTIRMEAVDCGVADSAVDRAIREASRLFQASPAGKQSGGYSYTLPQLISLAPGFQWEKYFSAAGLAEIQSFTLVNPPVVRRLEEVLVLNSLPDLKSYLDRCITVHHRAQ